MASIMTKHRFLRYLYGFLVAAFITLLGEFIKRYFEPANLVMLYLLGVVIVAVRWGRGPAIVCSVLSVLAFDFFLIRPYFTFAVEDWQYLVTFAGFLVVAVMISELTVKAREQAKKDKQLELLRATKKLQTALLNSISHDLRTPLTSIVGSISMLLQDAPSLGEETIKGLLQDAYGESLRLNRLVGNLLDMTRLEAGALNLTFKPCDLREILGVALQELAEKLEHRKVETRLPQELLEVNADFSLLSKVFVNLIDNAAKYSPEESVIRISAEAAGGQIKVRVSDEGLGIPPKELKKIFDKFYRATHPLPIEGIGLGLSISKGIVEAHHGEIRAESEPGKKGSTFTVLLPASGRNA